ncbi:hypothetical protein Tco_0410423 [Tanacetum coccineum]
MWCGCASAVVVADEDESDDGIDGDDVVMLFVMMAAAVGGSHGGDVGWEWIGGSDEDGCGEVVGIRPEVVGAAPEIRREEEDARRICEESTTITHPLRCQLFQSLRGHALHSKLFDEKFQSFSC